VARTGNDSQRQTPEARSRELRDEFGRGFDPSDAGVQGPAEPAVAPTARRKDKR
jgi:hypothetical protein